MENRKKKTFLVYQCIFECFFFLNYYNFVGFKCYINFISDNCLNGNEETSSSKKMMQTSSDLKQYIGYTNTQPIKHISESSLTLSQPLQIPVSNTILFLLLQINALTEIFLNFYHFVKLNKYEILI